MAEIVAVCIGEGRGSIKRPVIQAMLREDYGLVGDAHAGSVRQVSLLAVESIDKMFRALESINPERMHSQGVEINPGDSAENLVTKGVNLLSLEIGKQIRVGGTAVLEITEMGKAFHRPGFYLLPLEGIFARVICGGMVKPGDVLIY
jgi:MOSC domain-containing protein YiiM